MGNHYFTSEELTALQSNAFVKRASHKAITYTDEFKSHFYHEYLSGKPPRQIFREAGFNTSALGQSRIDSFTKRIKKQADRPEGFVDTRRFSSGRPATQSKTLEEEVAYLKHQLALKEQQIDFLKKMKALAIKHKTIHRKDSP